MTPDNTDGQEIQYLREQQKKTVFLDKLPFTTEDELGQSIYHFQKNSPTELERQPHHRESFRRDGREEDSQCEDR